MNVHFMSTKGKNRDNIHPRDPIRSIYVVFLPQTSMDMPAITGRMGVYPMDGGAVGAKQESMSDVLDA
jgi:hypothetical protein